MKDSSRRKNILEVIRYAFWGIVTTLFNLLVFNIMLICGINYVISNIVSYIIAVIVSYFFNNILVFRQKDSNNFKKVGKFVMVRVGALIADTLLLMFFVNLLSINIMAIKVILSISIILLTYVLNKLFVFKIYEGVEKN